MSMQNYLNKKCNYISIKGVVNMKKTIAIGIATIMLAVIFIGIAEKTNAYPAGWSDDKKIVDVSMTPTLNAPYDIAVSGNNIHVVYTTPRKDDTTYGDIYYKKSINNGLTWINEKLLSTNGAYARIAINGNNLHVIYSKVVYRNRTPHYGPWNLDKVDLVYIKSTTNGNTWSNPKTLTIFTTTGACGVYDIAVYKNNIHVVYLNGPIYQTTPFLYYKRSTDNGNTWLKQTILTRGVGEIKPTIAVSGNSVHVLYGSTKDKIYYMRSITNGLTWERSIRIGDISSADGEKLRCAVAVNGNNIHVIWGHKPIYYRKSTNNGLTFGNTIKITNEGYFPDIGVSGNKVHIVFLDPRWEKIYYKKSTNNGNTWQNEVSIGGSQPLYPLIAVYQNNLHVIWNGPHSSLWYKRSPPF